VSPTINSKQDTENNVNVNADKEKEGGYREQGPKTDLHKLPTINRDKAETESIAKDILNQLGDRKSLPFYHLVASKVPGQVIYITLSIIKHSGARSPAKVFASRMKEHAAHHADTRTQSLHSAMQDVQKKMILH